MLSSAWMMRLRSKIAKIDRPRPTRLCALPARGGAVERLAQQLHRPRVVEQDAALDVAHDHALRELRHQRREAVALLLDARVRLAHALLDVALERGVRVGEAVERRRQPPRLRRAARRRPVRGIGGEHDPRVLGELPRRRDVAAHERAHDERERHAAAGSEADDDARRRGPAGSRSEHRRFALGAGPRPRAATAAATAATTKPHAAASASANRTLSRHRLFAQQLARPSRSGPSSKTAWSRRRRRRRRCPWSPRRRVPWPRA